MKPRNAQREETQIFATGCRRAYILRIRAHLLSQGIRTGMSAASAGAGCLGTGPLATDEGLENGAAINLALPEGFHGEGDAAIGLLERGRDHRRVEL